MSGKKQKILRRVAQKLMEPWILKEVERREIERNQRGGLIDERLKQKDWIFEKAFKDEEVLGGVPLKHLGRLEQIQHSPIVNPPNFQNGENSCVVLSACTANRYYSWFNDKNNVNLNWRWIWDRIPKQAAGSKPSDVLEFLRNKGVPEVGKESDQNAAKYKIKSYFKLLDKSSANVYKALQKAPVLIGFWTDEAGFTTSRFAHEVLVVDVSEDGGQWQCLNWWNDSFQLYSEIPISTNLINAIIILDLPDMFDVSKIRLGWRGALSHYL